MSKLRIFIFGGSYKRGNKIVIRHPLWKSVYYRYFHRPNYKKDNTNNDVGYVGDSKNTD